MGAFGRIRNRGFFATCCKTALGLCDDRLVKSGHRAC